ncbi:MULTISPECIES: alanine racemase [unclassified Brevibacterium]|uniref:alanine racemase n=1 Tax=unclassified Brevibacterium TaxID=2614124 RepID=UPI0010F78BAC|nr:alanine racemase [Brevibacterium sp. 2SA]MCM1011683.1 alanine racemase [Brevibacterium sp. XM4083]
MTSRESQGSVVRAEIDAAALRANAAVLAAGIAPARLKCVVKANAYGHGVDIVATALHAAGHREFCVATLDEALHLRGLLGPDANIMAWLYGPESDLDAPLHADIALGVSTLGALDRILEATARTGTTARIHLKIDSGLGRNGLTPDDVADVLATLRDYAAVDRPRLVVAGIMSHFAVADEPDRPETAQQQQVFDAVRDDLVAVLDAAGGRLGEASDLDIHIANSPAALTLRPVPGTAARVGLALYGLSPLEDRSARDLGLTPVMRLVSEVVNLKDIPAGHGASYGLTYTAETDTRFALVPGGYGDGLPRSASNRAAVTIRGQRFPVIGRIAMDQFIVDVGDAEVAVGDEVVIFGPDGPSADEWGAWADTINYEIVTRISARVDRLGVDVTRADVDVDGSGVSDSGTDIAGGREGAA